MNRATGKTDEIIRLTIEAAKRGERCEMWVASREKAVEVARQMVTQYGGKRSYGSTTVYFDDSPICIRTPDFPLRDDAEVWIGKIRLEDDDE